MAGCRYARNTSEFKSKVALEALREQQPIHEIAKRYQIHPTQVTQWKKELLGNASSVFESASSKHDESFKQKLKEDRLYKQSDRDSVNCTFVIFMKQSICRDNPSALHNSVACEDAGSACARFLCTQPYQDS